MAAALWAWGGRAAIFSGAFLFEFVGQEGFFVVADADDFSADGDFGLGGADVLGGEGFAEGPAFGVGLIGDDEGGFGGGIEEGGDGFAIDESEAAEDEGVGRVDGAGEGRVRDEGGELGGVEGFGEIGVFGGVLRGKGAE